MVGRNFSSSRVREIQEQWCTLRACKKFHIHHVSTQFSECKCSYIPRFAYFSGRNCQTHLVPESKNLKDGEQWMKIMSFPNGSKRTFSD